MFEAEESRREKEIPTKGVGDREKKCVGGGRVHLIKECFLASSQPSEMMTYKIEMYEKVNLLRPKRSRTSPIQSPNSMECFKNLSTNAKK